MEYPTIQSVEIADREQICRWYRFLKTPVNQEQEAVMQRVCERCNALGGFTPEISKSIGWDEPGGGE